MKRETHRRGTFSTARYLFVLALLASVPLSTPVVFGQDEDSAAEDSASAAETTEVTPKKSSPKKNAEAEEEENEIPPPAPQAGSQPKAAGSESASSAVKPWQLSVEPIFKGPTVKRFTTPSDLTGRDRQILESLDYKASGTKLRLEQIRKLTGEIKKAPLRSPAALTSTLNMLRLYEEQGMVFEWMRVVGITDPKYPDLNATLKNIRRQQAQRYQDLVLNYPKDPNVKTWKFKLMVARLKLGDPSVREPAIAMLKTLQGIEQHELAAVGLTLDAANGRLPSPFGTIEQVMQGSTDQYEGAAFKLMLAEQEITKNNAPAALALLQDVIATCKNIRKADKEQTPGTILQAAASLLMGIGLKGPGVNQEVYQALVNNDLIEYARSYLEQFALASYTKNLPSALKAYGDALALGQPSDALKGQVEARMLDLTIAAGDPKMISIAWERVISRGVQKSVNLDPQMLYSINTVMGQFRAKPEKDVATRIISMHDSFVRGFPVYAAREDYELRMIEMLFQTQQFGDVGRRSEIAANKFKDKMNKISALQYNLRARASLMGLGSDIKIAPIPKLLGDPILAKGFVTNADKIRQLMANPEGEQWQFMAAFVQLMQGDKQALVRFESALTRAPRHPLAGESATVLLEVLNQRKEFTAIEKNIRLMIKTGVVPVREPWRNLKPSLEKSIFEHASLLLNNKQFDAAAIRFANFQKEFPSSANAPAALERAAVAFAQAKKPEIAMQAYELYLKLYSRLPQSKEIRWAAAELARGNKQHLKAAENYQSFAAAFPQDAEKRQAHLRAAESYRDAKKLPEAIGEFEKHLKFAKTADEQKKVLEAIALLAQRSNNGAIELSANERLVKIVKSPDDVLSIQFNLLIVYQKLGRDELAKKAAAAALAIKPTNPEGFKMQSKARLAAARFEVNALRTRQVMNQKDLKVAVDTLVKDYERVKNSLLAPCEIPGVNWCSLGYYEVSKLSGDLSRLLGLVEPQADQDELVVAELKSMITFNKDKLKSEERSFALQAEDAIVSSGGPDPETIEKIKLYVNQVKQGRADSAAEDTGGEF